VALKILSPEKQNDPQFAERFEREARALAWLTHPNIVTVYDFGETQGNYYLLMEFLDGMTLRQLLRARKLASTEALAIVPQICQALQYAHEQGIIHRDIKPENILLDKKGQVKIADFGIAKLLDQAPQDISLTGAKNVVGTPHYMAPEQIEKPQTVDHRADIYSLGVVFYEMLTGELPLGNFQPPSQKIQIDVRLDEVVLRALEKEPERRYQQAGEVKTAVQTIASTAPPKAKTFAVRGRLWPAVGIAAIVVAMLAVAFVLLRPSQVRRPQDHVPLAGVMPETRETMPAGQENQRAAEANAEPAKQTELAPRNLANEFEALKAIEDATARDLKLVQFAKDAARAGDAEMVKLSLETIVAANYHDSAAGVCVRLLAKAGKQAEANEVAKAIREPQTRRAVLAQLISDPPLVDTNAPSTSRLPGTRGSSDLATQFEAIKAIEDWPARDLKLTQFAKDAARIGDVKMMELALETIVATNFRDDAAMVCVRLLAKAGKQAEATEAAKDIKVDSHGRSFWPN